MTITHLNISDSSTQTHSERPSLDRDMSYVIRRAALRSLATGPHTRLRVLWIRQYRLSWPLCLHTTLSAWLVRIGIVHKSGYITQTVFVLYDRQGFTLAHPYTYGGIDLFSTRGWYVDSSVFPRRENGDQR